MTVRFEIGPSEGIRVPPDVLVRHGDVRPGDTSFNVKTPCERHVANPADPNPGKGCVDPPPNSVFYPFYTTRMTSSGCMWQEGGAYIPGTKDEFGGNAHAEYGPNRIVEYPTSPFGTVTQRLNVFRSNALANPCPASS